MVYYPIDIQEIQVKVSKKRTRKYIPKNFSVFYDNSNVKEVENNFGEKLVRIDGTIPTDLPVENGQRFLFISYDQSRLSHGIHKYPAKFFPELPRWLVQKYSKVGNLILDPFMGSATTNIECLLNDRNSVGVDVDPFARFLAKVKTTPLNETELNETNQILLEQIISFQPILIKDEQIPTFPYRDNWFQPEILKELTYIKQIIDNLKVSQDLKDFYKVCFSSIIRNVSNADDNCTRTVVRKKLNKQIYPSFALTKFVENLLTFTPRMVEFSESIANVSLEIPQNSDARNIEYQDNTFDLAITSPPYANAVDYPRTHQLELYWLGLAEGSLAELKKLHIGTESVSVEHYKKLHSIGVESADNVLKTIYETDPRRSYICYKYLLDMVQNMQEVYRTLKKGGRYIIVVGNNIVRKQNFETWRYLMPLAEQIGYSVECHFGSEIIKHFIKVPREQRINTDWVIVLQK
jgi:DNA modification methylase